jgi:hypothetical protein
MATGSAVPSPSELIACVADADEGAIEPYAGEASGSCRLDWANIALAASIILRIGSLLGWRVDQSARESGGTPFYPCM